MKGVQISPKCPNCNINMQKKEIIHPTVDETKSSSSYTNSTSSYVPVDTVAVQDEIIISTYICPKCGYQKQILEE